MKAVSDRVIVERDTMPEKTAGGLIVPDAYRGKSERATVIAAGPECEKIKAFNAIKAGVKVIVPKSGGTEVTHEGHTYHIFRAGDIEMVL